MRPSLAQFAAVPAEVPIRPIHRPKPLAQLQIARVVGPKDGDPFVDEFGRIKVQFPWDRDGAFDEKSSCWIRMATPVAHGDEGFFSAHKVGSEVLVDFIDGDIDRPVVIAALYNGQERQPYKQPDLAARSSWKVKSIPGGKGYNEITFDNSAGKENVLTHAQHDRTTKVLHNHVETVGANQTVSVGANQTTTVGANRTATVGADDTTTITGNRKEAVLTKEDVTVMKGRTHTVDSGDDMLYLPHGNREIDVYEGNHTLNAKLLVSSHSDNHEIEARYDFHARAVRKIEIAQKGASCTMEDEHVVVVAPQHIILDCPSGAAFFKDKKLVLQAVEELVLQCGESALSLKKDGTILVQSTKQIGAAVSNSSMKLEPTKAAVSGAAVEVNAVGQCKIAGALVKIN
jgi:type VI secretion system secreted protein VgrG